jgi:hypothetical protein
LHTGRKEKERRGYRRERECSVDTVTRLRAVIQFPTEATDFSSAKRPRKIKGPPCLLFIEHRGIILQK